MKEITDYDKVFETLVQKTQDYVVRNNLNCMVLGISGGIDSTVVAAICSEVSERTDIPLIGTSLPTKFNKEAEITTADLVGKAFCNDYKEIPIMYPYDAFLDFLEAAGDSTTPISNGNIQARLRMIYLYNLANIHKGIVMDTDNLTENNLGYFTIHGDVGDFNPIGCLWKTEVFKLAEYLIDFYRMASQIDKSIAIFNSWSLKPTAGLGITNSDLDEIGAESYDQVDGILQEILAWKEWAKRRGDFPESIKEQQEMFLDEQQLLCYPYPVVDAVTKRHFASDFKRKQLPIKITRDEI